MNFSKLLERSFGAVTLGVALAAPVQAQEPPQPKMTSDPISVCFMKQSTGPTEVELEDPAKRQKECLKLVEVTRLLKQGTPEGMNEAMRLLASNIKSLAP